MAHRRSCMLRSGSSPASSQTPLSAKDRKHEYTGHPVRFVRHECVLSNPTTLLIACDATSRLQTAWYTLVCHLADSKAPQRTEEPGFLGSEIGGLPFSCAPLEPACMIFAAILRAIPVCFPVLWPTPFWVGSRATCKYTASISHHDHPDHPDDDATRAAMPGP